MMEALRKFRIPHNLGAPLFFFATREHQGGGREPVTINRTCFTHQADVTAPKIRGIAPARRSYSTELDVVDERTAFDAIITVFHPSILSRRV